MYTVQFNAPRLVFWAVYWIVIAASVNGALWAATIFLAVYAKVMGIDL